MRNKLLLILSFLFGSLYLSNPVFSEIIVLKSGQTVQGKIIEEKEKYVKLELGGIPLTYYREDIERIDPDPVNKPVEIKIKAVTISKEEFLTKIGVSGEKIMTIKQKAFADAQKVKGGKSNPEYSHIIHEGVADIRGEIKEINRLSVPNNCQKLKELFVENYDSHVEQLLDDINGSLTKEERENHVKKWGQTQEKYAKERDRVSLEKE